MTELGLKRKPSDSRALTLNYRYCSEIILFNCVSFVAVPLPSFSPLTVMKGLLAQGLCVPGSVVGPEPRAGLVHNTYLINSWTTDGCSRPQHMEGTLQTVRHTHYLEYKHNSKIVTQIKHKFLSVFLKGKWSRVEGWLSSTRTPKDSGSFHLVTLPPFGRCLHIHRWSRLTLTSPQEGGKEAGGKQVPYTNGRWGLYSPVLLAGFFSCKESLET